MISYSIYIIDDEPSIREGISMALEAQYSISSFENAEHAIEELKHNTPPDLILLDIGLPGMNGNEALKYIKAMHPDIIIIMITAYEDTSTVIQAMKLGAYDYVIKPILMDGLEVSIQNALETIRLRKEVKALQAKYLSDNLPCFIAQSKAIHNIMNFIQIIAKSPDTPIIILGETGTGKEWIAGAIHYRSPNFRGRLVTLNCASIPKELIESELFGYEKGAFSGADAAGKKGLIEEAQGGTLFLDEIGDLSPEAQAKLLRFLEKGEFFRVGGTKKLNIQTRVISATNRDLKDMISQNTFREDLYYRLAVITIEVPSLKDRKEDILPIAMHFLYEFSQKFSKTFTCLSQDASNALLNYQWRGNVRELKNIMERGVLIGKGPILEVEDLGIENNPAKTADTGFSPLTPGGIDLCSIEKTMERFYIKEALKMSGGNEIKAAKLLNLNHHTFRYRRKNLNISKIP